MDIDIVYMWVDGNDPVWLKKKNKYLGKAEGQNEELSGICRYEQHDELLYSLRSVSCYAPWIRYIYIVTDGQVPVWLNTDHPKLKIIDHKEIIEERYLPLFNSTAIELNLARIPGLSEYFLLANDDTYFGRPVSPSFFFTSDNKPIVRFKYKNIVRGFSHYQDMLMDMVDETVRRSGPCCIKAPHHNIDAYLKSEWLDCIRYYESWTRKTLEHRFRSEGDMHRHLISLWMLQNKQACEKEVSKWNGITGFWNRIKARLTFHYAADSRYISMRAVSFRLNKWYHNPALFNINDYQKAKAYHRKKMVHFLEHCFPVPSPYEKSLP